LIAELGVRSLPDIPCGDLPRMQNPALYQDHTGTDILPEVVADNAPLSDTLRTIRDHRIWNGGRTPTNSSRS